MNDYTVDWMTLQRHTDDPRIVGKLGVASRTEAASLAYRQGIVRR